MKRNVILSVADDQLFDLAKDLWERESLAAERPDRVSEMETLLTT